jgi:hypothetical protein
MKNKVLVTLIGILMSSQISMAQISFGNINYWLGSGPDSTALVINFNNGKTDSCVSWGYLFTDSVEAKTMLTDIKTNDPNVDFHMGAFLDSIAYIGSSYRGGDNGFYWGMWTYEASTWNQNAGLAAQIKDGEQLGLSYTNFNPAVLPPVAIAVNNPNAFTFSDVQWWLGSGSDSSVLVVDFLQNGSSHAWGFLHNGSITGKQMLLAIDAAEPNLEVYTGNFLDSIKFKTSQGINGDNFNYWNTWTASNVGGWNSNAGIGTEVKNGEFFGCSFTGWPAFKPNVPEAVANSTSAFEVESTKVNIYPNPATVSDIVEFDIAINAAFTIIVMDNTGKLVYQKEGRSGEDLFIESGLLKNGLYFIDVKTSDVMYQSTLVIAGK